jgi:peptidyl-dipeptidase A
MYVELHAFVRARLAEHYGPKVADANAFTTAFTSRMLQVVDATKAIPAHLLGNMWAQSWGNLCVRLRVAAATHCHTLHMYSIIV